MLTVITPPSEEPVSLAEAKQHIDLTGSSHDDMLGRLISAGREQFERFTERRCITQTLEMTFDEWPALYPSTYRYRTEPLKIPLAKVQSIESITYVGTDGVDVVFDDLNYALLDDTPGKIQLAYGVGWPSARYHPGSIRVQFVVGYGTADEVPAVVKQGILKLVEDNFETRGSVLAGQGVFAIEVPQTTLWLWEGERWGGYS